jgi:hypothetical protein
MILLIVCIVIAALFAGSLFLVMISLFPHTSSREDVYEAEIERGSIDEAFYKALNKQEFSVKSKFDYQLHGIWFPNQDSLKTVVIVHGYKVNLFTSLRYLRLFYDKGFNVLIYDQRYHGKSGGKNCSMGFYEKYDLQTMVTWVLGKTGPMSVVGIHGESMGAATSIMHAAIDDRISFTVADCSYEDLYRQFTHRLKVDYKLPSFPLMHLGSLVTKITMGYFFRNVSPISDIAYIKTPLLFIHGEKDSYILPSHSFHMYEKARGRKGLYLAKDAGHAESIFANPEEYQKIVYRFIDTL